MKHPIIYLRNTMSIRSTLELAQLDSYHQLTSEEQAYLVDKFGVLSHYVKSDDDASFEDYFLTWLHGDDNGVNSAYLRNQSKTPAELPALGFLGQDEAKTAKLFALINKLIERWNPEGKQFYTVESDNPEILIYRCDDLDEMAFWQESIASTIQILYAIPEFNVLRGFSPIEFKLADAEYPLYCLKKEKKGKYIPHPVEYHIQKINIAPAPYNGEEIDIATCNAYDELSYALEGTYKKKYRRSQDVIDEWTVEFFFELDKEILAEG
jgi:hypothetical protein